jgi:Putative prokaryotic signal transducing protein
MPLVYVPGSKHEASERQRKARKIKPQYAEGELVKVARAENQIEAEFIAGLLLEEGIPCLQSGLIAGYAPTIGARDILVPESGAQAAREALAWDEA